MAQRELLQAELETILGTRNVYFQPPDNLQLTYPAIVYTRDSSDKTFANNNPYHNEKRYQLTVIDRNPDSEIPDKIDSLALTTFVRSFTADNLNHFIYNIYF